MIRVLLLAFALAVTCGEVALAAPAVVHIGDTTGGVGATLTATLSGTPTNGNIVSATGVIGTNSPSVKDSNSVSLTLRTAAGSSNQIWDYVVAGSPSATYTASANAVLDLGLIEIAGATLGGGTNYCSQSSGSSCSVTTSSGDIVECSIRSSSADTVTISNAGSVTYIFQDATNDAASAYAAATGSSSTCSGTSVTSAMAADYSASAIAPVVEQVIGEYNPDGSYEDADSARFVAVMTMRQRTPLFAEMVRYL